MGDILKISEAAALALHAMTMLAEQGEGRHLSTKEMAAKLKASAAHLAKVLQRLEKAELVASIRGPKGGFVLGKDASEIRLLDIYEAIEGRISPTRCLFGEPVCSRSGCILGETIKSASEAIIARMADTRLSDVQERNAKRASGGVPSAESVGPAAMPVPPGEETFR
ncbi:MAG: Rrf2 family transcriptional regulator [Planctomycetota bacterium]|nr:Rrf2 family transcriptional regulator [Planctomycetota bacterium]